MARSSSGNALVTVIVAAMILAAGVMKSPALRALVREEIHQTKTGAPAAPVGNGLREDRPSSSGPSSPSPGSAAGVDAVLAACPLGGTARGEVVRDLNLQKNRTSIPAAADFDTTVTLAALLRPGEDSERWSDDRAATVTGWVVKVKSGGKETVNCGAGQDRDRDTHIELALSPGDTDGRHHVIVEVTPRMRAQVSDDWSTEALRARLLHHRVRVTGWLLFDAEHRNAAENTEPGGAHNWRATAWEVHPITKLEVLN